MVSNKQHTITPERQQPERTPRILVVEDDTNLMEGMREILELDGYEVLTATSGVGGLEILRQSEEAPDLIVSDIMMPKMDGYEFFEKVRSYEEWISIPFVFLSARGEKSDVRLGKSMGADDYVIKPFSVEDLLVTVSSKLQRHQQLQTVFSGKVTEVKRSILTILNHEFRTPLTYVIAYADMLDRDADQMTLDEMRDFLRGVNSGAERLKRLVENFIFLVELETGELETSFALRKTLIYDYEEVIESAFKYVEVEMKNKGCALDIHIEAEPPAILGDREYLVAAIARLIDNAIKFSKPNSDIKLAMYTADEHFIFAVTDNGRGIPEEEVPLIFDSFYQINRPLYEDQGAGIGLTIVQGIATVHGAEITVETEVDKGSTIRLHFPIPPAE